MLTGARDANVVSSSLQRVLALPLCLVTELGSTTVRASAQTVVDSATVVRLVHFTGRYCLCLGAEKEEERQNFDYYVEIFHS